MDSIRLDIVAPTHCYLEREIWIVLKAPVSTTPQSFKLNRHKKHLLKEMQYITTDPN